MATVKIKGRDGVQTCELTAPTSYALRFDVWRAAAENHTRAVAAALGFCHPKTGRGIRFKGDVLDFGGQVIDRLIGEGVALKSILTAGTIAFDLCINGLTDLIEEVEDAAGFSDPPAASSTA